MWVDYTISSSEQYLKQSPNEKEIEKTIQTLRDFGIKIKKDGFNKIKTNFELGQYRKTLILNKLKKKVR